MTISESTLDSLSKAGFKNLRGRVFVRVTGDILTWLQLPTGKTLIKFWYCVYPLIDFEISVNQHSIGLGGWLPTEKNETLDARQVANDVVEKLLDRLVLNQFLPLVSKLNSAEHCLESIPAKGTTLFPSSLPYWLLLEGSVAEAMRYFRVMTLDKNHHYYGRPEGDAAAELYSVLKGSDHINNDAKILLVRNRERNIKKLRLNRVIKLAKGRTKSTD